MDFYFWFSTISISLLFAGIILGFLNRKYDKKIKELEREKESKRQLLYESLYDGIYKGRRDTHLTMGTGFRFKIRKGELYNIERMEDKYGYFTVEVTRGFYIILNCEQVDKYFEKVSDKELKVPKVESAER